MLKKGDIVIIAAALILAVLSAVLIGVFSASGKTVTVKQDNKVVYEGSLFEDKTVKLDGNTAVIEDGKVRMKSADCKNHYCIKQGEISKTGESIVCLPNKVIIEIG